MCPGGHRPLVPLQRNSFQGNFLAVQWLNSVCSLQRAQVQSLVGEVKSHKSLSTAPLRPPKKEEE